MNGLRSLIQTDIGGINKLIDAANSAIPFGDPIPHIDVPSLDALQNVQLPSEFTTALQNLNNSLPSVAELKDKYSRAWLHSPIFLRALQVNGRTWHDYDIGRQSQSVVAYNQMQGYAKRIQQAKASSSKAGPKAKTPETTPQLTPASAASYQAHFAAVMAPVEGMFKLIVFLSAGILIIILLVAATATMSLEDDSTASA